MELDKACRQIEERLEKIDFAALFSGFSRFPFALYDDVSAFVGGRIIPRPDTFLANTSVLYEGAQTAIWKLDEEEPDFDVLTSKLVHEMLHAFQNASGETRWADERAALTGYRYEEANLAARLEEADLLRECLRENAPEAFSRLLSLRKARMDRFPYEYDYEARIEQIEGTAHFVELAALGQLDADKARKKWEELLCALADSGRYYPARSVSYLTGAAFIACLKKYSDLDTDRFTGVPFSVAALEQALPCALPEHDPRAAACLEKGRAQARSTVERAIRKGDLFLEGEYRLIAWNVFDASWDGQYAVLTGFIGYLEGTVLPDTDEELFALMKVVQGDFVAEVDEKLCMTRVWRQ